jgi:hypothetical protein
MNSKLCERISNFEVSIDNFKLTNEKITIEDEEYSILCNRYAGGDTDHLIVLDKNGVVYLVVCPPDDNKYIFYRLKIDNKDWVLKERN